MGRIFIIKSFFYRVISILSILLIISLFYTIYTYVTHEKKQQYIKAEIAEQISSEVSDFFKENETLLQYFGRVIAQGKKYKDLNLISDLLTTTGELSLKSLTTSYISWADSSGIITVNGKSGINKNPSKNILSRKYFSTCREFPWTLQVSPLTKSIFSSKIILPTAMGISHEGQFIGYLVLGLWIEDLIMNLKNKINLHRHDFLIIDEKSREIIGGSQNHFSEDIILNQSSIIVGNINYNTFSKVNNTSFKVFVGMDKESYTRQVIWEVVSKVMEFLGVLLVFLLVVMFFLKHNVLKPLNELNQKAKQFSEKTNNHKIINSTIFGIMTVADSILSMQKYLIQLKKSNDTLKANFKISELSFLEKEKHYQNALSRTKRVLEDIEVCLKVIEKAGINQKEANHLLTHCKGLVHGNYLQASGHMTHTVFDVNNLLHECINYFNKEALDNDIKILLSFSRTVPMYQGDRFQLKQIIIASISKAINSVFEKGVISLESTYDTVKEEFSICIADDGVLDGQYNQVINSSSAINDAVLDLNSPIAVLSELLKAENSHIVVTIQAQKTIIIIQNTPKSSMKKANNLINIKDYQEG